MLFQYPQACLCSIPQSGYCISQSGIIIYAQFLQLIIIIQTTARLVLAMFAHANKLFLVIIALSALTYFERADYNLPLFAFALLLWDYRQPQQKTRMWYLMAFSLLTDVIWIIYWAAVWNSYNNREKGICMFTLIVSIVEFIVKLATVVILFMKQPECKGAITNLPQNVKSIFKGPSEYQAV